MTLHDEDFDETATGTLPAAWTNESVNTLEVSSDTYYSAPNCLKLNNIVGGNQYGRYEGVVDDLGAVFFRAKMTLTTTSANIFLQETTGNVDINKLGATISFRIDGTIRYYNGSAWVLIQNYSADTWYTFKIVPNFTTQAADIYIDDMDDPVVTAGHFWKAVTGCASVQFYSGVASTTIYIDDFAVWDKHIRKQLTSKVHVSKDYEEQDIFIALEANATESTDIDADYITESGYGATIYAASAYTYAWDTINNLTIGDATIAGSADVTVTCKLNVSGTTTGSVTYDQTANDTLTITDLEVYGTLHASPYVAGGGNDSMPFWVIGGMP